MIVDATDYQLEPASWMSDAACAGMANRADVFFPTRGATAETARAICAACPVTAECLAYALRWRIPHGIWGGTSARERRRLIDNKRPRRQPPRHGTGARYRAGCRCQRCLEAHMAYLGNGGRQAGHLGNLNELFYLIILFLFVLILLRVLRLV